MNWQQEAASLQWNIRPFIDGRYRTSEARDFFDDLNPATESALCQVAVGSVSDVNDAVSVARKRFDDGSWSGLSPSKRGEILVKLSELIVKHKVELALLDSLEMGKPIQAALDDAEYYATTLLRTWASCADKLHGETVPILGAALSFNVYEPRGVIGAITPWNFPSVNAVYKIGPALAAGNSVVLKPSELASGSALKLAELALEAGVPAGVLNVTPGLGAVVGAALALHDDVDMLTFTGSTATGRRIMELCGRSNGKRLLLECGGKSPEIVFSDAPNLDLVADSVSTGVLLNQGQVCSAHTRLLVHADVKDKLLEKLISRLRKHEPGDPLNPATTFGPLASPVQRDRVKNYVAQGLQDGAEAVLLGPIQERNGCFVSPTIFDRVKSTMSVVRDEIFGPVLCVQEFQTEEEALHLANETAYGLMATVWTSDSGRGRRMARSIRAGAVVVRTSGNEDPDPAGSVLSFEPQKASGFGSEIGVRGLASYSSLKLVCFNGS